jgi:hypothetical protein
MAMKFLPHHLLGLGYAQVGRRRADAFSLPLRARYGAA